MGRPAPSFKLVSWKISELIRSPLNARVGIEEDPDTLDLAASIKAHGVLQDPAVRSDGTIIYGTRRVYAAGLAGLKTIQCKTYAATLTPIVEHSLRIEENLRRKDLNAIEKAKELKSLVDMQPGKAKQQAAAGLLSLSEAAVSRTLALLDLPQVWQALIANGTAEATHTRCVETAARLHETLPGELARLYEQLRSTRSLSTRDWEAETARFIEERSRPLHAEGSKAILPHFAPHKGDLDVRYLAGRPLAFNVDLWRKITREHEAKQVSPAPSQRDDRPLPALGHRQRIARNWFNHRILSYIHRHPAAAAKWLPLLEIPARLTFEAIAAARALKDWSIEPEKSIPIVKKVPASAVSTFLANYLQELAAIALRGRLLVAKDFHFVKALAAAIGIDYATEFLKTLDDDDRKDIAQVYGSLPSPGKFPRGMDPRSLQIASRST